MIKREYQDSIVYILFIFVAILPVVYPLGIPNSVTPAATDYYNAIKGLPQGSVVLIEVYSDIRAWFTMGPSTVATIKQLIPMIQGGQIKGIVFTTTSDAGPLSIPLIERMATATDVSSKLKYGDQWALMGWIPGFETAQAQMAQDFRAAVPRDYYGTAIDQLPILNGIKKISDFQLIIINSDSNLDAYVRQWGGKGPKILANIDISVLALTKPYLDRGIINGYMTPVKLTSEYEKLVGFSGFGSALNEGQSTVQVYIVLLIIAANVIYFRERQRKK